MAFDPFSRVRGCNAPGRVYTAFMTTEALREAIRTRRPFSITMADGRTLEVPHAEFIAISPSGRILYIAKDNDQLEALDVLLITGVQQERKLPS